MSHPCFASTSGWFGITSIYLPADLTAGFLYVEHKENKTHVEQEKKNLKQQENENAEIPQDAYKNQSQISLK